MNVALSWWNPSAGGSRQAVRGNFKGLSDAGHDVTLVFQDNLGALEAGARAGEYDVVVLPYIHYPGDLTAYADTHLHLQLGGLPVNPNPEVAARSIVAADTVSVLDPSFLDYYGDLFDDLGVTPAFVPNPPNHDLFERQPADACEDHALVAKLGSSQQGAPELAEIAKQALTETFVVRYTGENRPHLPDNVWLRPPVPLTAMPRQYRDARVVVNPTDRDVLPNTAFETFLSGRPYIAHEGALADVQTLPADALDPATFGLAASEWRERYSDAIGTGDHYVTGESPEAIGDAVFQLMTDTARWHDVVAATDDWVAAWDGWDWEAKGECLTALWTR